MPKAEDTVKTAPKCGDAVIFTENGKQYLATILGVRELDHHSGTDDEPLLNLGFFKSVLVPNGKGKLEESYPFGTSAQHSMVQFRADVVHESHEFSEAANKVGFKGTYPGGRWKELKKKKAVD